MKKYSMIVALVLFSPFVLMAQDTPAVEIFGGYQYLKFEEEGMHGFTAAVEGNLHRNIGIVGEVGLATKAFEEDRFTPVTFMVGPRLSYRSEAIRIFGHAMIGGFRFAGKRGGESFSESYLAAVFGGGLDVFLTERLSIRPAQVDLLTIRVSHENNSEWFNEFRYSAGLVFKFGNR